MTKNGQSIESLPQSWEQPTLEDVCEILDRRRIPVNNSERQKRVAGKKPSELYPYYGATGQVGLIDDYIFEGEHVLLGEDGAPFLDPFKNKAYIASGKFWVNNHAHILRASASNRYLCYYLNYCDYSKFVTGTTRLKLNQAVVKSIPVRFAPENEQERIVSKIEQLFSELDNGIDSLKTVREQLKVYRQAVLKHAFEGKLTEKWREDNKDKLEKPGELLERIEKVRQERNEQQIEEWKAAVIAWEEDGKRGPRPRKPPNYKATKPISAKELSLLPTIASDWEFVRLTEVAQIGSGMSVSKSRKLADPLEIPYLRVANVQRGFLVLDEIKSMPIERTQIHGLALKKWDVLFNEGGDRDKLGRGWIWRAEIEPCITQNHVFRASLYLASEHAAKMLSHWGNTFGQKYFEETGKQTTNLASINKTVLSEFPVPLISPAEQHEICIRIDQSMTLIDNQEREVEYALRRSELMRQSILRRAFSGELVAQDPKDEPASELLARINVEKEELGKVKKASKKKIQRKSKRKDAA